MIQNPVRKALLERKLTFGTWIQIGHPAPAEILASVGYEWLVVDCEHSAIDVAGFASVARGMFGRGAVSLVRVRENDTLAIRRVLDSGAMGVIVPLVNSAEEARRAVAAAKYPPLGVRGHCFSRMNSWGADFEEYARSANDEIVAVVMIESKEAVENVDDILAVEGVDGVMIGQYDLSSSYGLVGQLDHETIVGARQTVLDACERAGKSAGLHLTVPTPESLKKVIAEGFTFLALGMDSVFLSQAAKETLELARSAGG